MQLVLEKLGRGLVVREMKEADLAPTPHKMDINRKGLAAVRASGCQGSQESGAEPKLGIWQQECSFIVSLIFLLTLLCPESS